MKKILILVLVVIIAMGSIVGCDSKSEDKSSPYRVAYITMDITSPYFIKMIDGMKEEAKEMNIEFTVHDGKYQAQPQIDIMETLIVQKVDAIILSANDPVALQPYVDKAKEAGIKVITANVEMKNADAHISLVEYDYGFTGGVIAGKYIKEHLDGEAEVAVLAFTQVPAVIERVRGLKEGILSLAPNAKFVFETDAYTRELGMNAIETALQSNPDLNVVVGINDDAVLGAYEAMTAAGRTGDDVILVGLDAVDEAILKIKEGGIYRGTVDIAPFDSGEIIIKTTIEVIKNGPIEEMIKFPMNTITVDNVNDY